jgi:Xaa-Pro aminopeptidase
VITRSRAGLWTDSRYYLAAEAALTGTSIELFRHGMPDVPDYPQFLAESLQPGSVVGFPGRLLGVSTHRRILRSLERAGITTRATHDLFADVWRDRPPLPNEPIYEHHVQYAGTAREAKLAQLREELEARECQWTVVATLDDIAWLFNLRGTDVPYNPVFLSFAVVGHDRTVLCVHQASLSDQLRTDLEAGGVSILDYHTVDEVVRSIPVESRVLVDPERINVELFQAIPGTIVEEMNPTTRLKARKTPAELENLRRCMIRDGAAMVEFLAWLTQSIADGVTLTEYDAQKRLREFRAAGDLFVSESFETISAYKDHAPIVHYSASPSDSASLAADGLYLVDSGGQYMDGTTDITRTIPLGSLRREEKVDYTLVLKAHIALATTVFPAGTTGHELDAIARRPLWDHMRNYGHGTGHGVGYFLNVHEGPQRISPRPSTIALEPGMLISNEPGVYHTGDYGIRIENLVVVGPEEETSFGGFHRFETVTLCPIDTRAIERSLLSPEEREWLNAYHLRVRDSLMDHLSDGARAWLSNATDPI